MGSVYFIKFGNFLAKIANFMKNNRKTNKKKTGKIETESKRSKKEIGSLGESIAAVYLENKGYEIIGQGSAMRLSLLLGFREQVLRTAKCGIERVHNGTVSQCLLIFH